MSKKAREVTNPIITNIMADGSICEDLSKYVPKEIPVTAARIVRQLVENGHKLRMESGDLDS